MFAGGRNNPIVRAAEFTRAYKKYLNEDHDPNEMFNPNVDTVHIPETPRRDKIFKVGRTDGSTSNVEHYPSEYGDMGKGGFKSGKVFDEERKSQMPPNFGSLMLSIDDNLKLLASVQKERNILGGMGLSIDPNDEILLMKDRTGNLKGAIIISRDHSNNLKHIKYMDVDTDAMNFKKSLSKLITSKIGGTAIYYEDIEVHRIHIPKEFIAD